jgi:hypothetical protein
LWSDVNLLEARGVSTCRSRDQFFIGEKKALLFDVPFRLFDFQPPIFLDVVGNDDCDAAFVPLLKPPAFGLPIFFPLAPRLEQLDETPKACGLSCWKRFDRERDRIRERRIPSRSRSRARL